jgi:hypothetical protein
MSKCEGRGECFQQCACGCYDDEEYEIPSVVCTCGHRNHIEMLGSTNSDETNKYCREECPHNCKLIECHNFKICGQKRPQRLLDCHDGMCWDCRLLVGKIQILDKVDDCPVCMETKKMILVSCGKHEFCFDCWKKISESRPSPLTCPLCRESIWKYRIISNYSS